jgi:molybdenum cofactor biosynthesis protein B
VHRILQEIMTALHDKPRIRVLTATVSDTRTRANDESGKILDELLKEAGIDLVRHVIVKDEAVFIQELVRGIADANDAEAIVLTGGTGIAQRDCTPEALDEVLEKRLEGFGEAFRRLSWEEIGPRAILSRATAGVTNRCIVFALPGNPAAVRLGVTKLILPMLEHGVDIAQGRSKHPHGHK